MDKLIYVRSEDEAEEVAFENSEASLDHAEDICSCGCMVKLFFHLEQMIAEVWEKGKKEDSDFEVMEKEAYFFLIEKAFKNS
jgi:hypothetical protein